MRRERDDEAAERDEMILSLGGRPGEQESS
jgi:hypothetical protein